MLNREIPFLRIGLPLCLGIIAGLYFSPGTWFLVISLIIITCGFLVGILWNRQQYNIIYGITFSSVFFLSGLVLYTLEKNRLSVLPPVPSIFLCTLSEYPEEKENSFKLILDLNYQITEKEPLPLNGSILLYSRKEQFVYSLLPGDQMVIKCTPEEISNRGNPDEFNYRFYMENHGIRYSAFSGAGEIYRFRVPGRRKLIHRALIVREKIIKMYENRGITGERLALVAAMTLGQKNMLDPEQKQNFIKAGVMHIMAVSGLHAVILSFFVFNLLFFLKRKYNILRILITIFFLWAFAFVTGLTPSVLRATIMFSFLQAGNLMKRRVNSINSVLASAFVLIMIRPSVIFDAGFLLSYSAVIFIICFYKDLYLSLRFRYRIPDMIWQSAVVTIVAQAGTLPLTISLFNRFPALFILTNIIIVPLSSLLIIVGCLVPLTYPLRFISQPLASLLSHLTGLTEYLTAKAASVSWSTIENIGMTGTESFLLFTFIFLLAWFVLKQESFSVHLPVAAFLMFILAGSIKEISNRSSRELIIYNSLSSSPVGIRTGNKLDLYSGNEHSPPEVMRHCATQRLELNSIRNIKRSCFIRSAGDRIIICNSLNNSMLNKYKPDYIVLTGKFPVIEQSLDIVSPVKGLIICADVSPGFRIPRGWDTGKIDTVHFVRTSAGFSVLIK